MSRMVSGAGGWPRPQIVHQRRSQCVQLRLRSGVGEGGGLLSVSILNISASLFLCLFIKPSNKQLYLDYNSNHPLQCKQSIPYSQALRVVERCATTADRDFHLDNLRGKLEARNYPASVIDKKFDEAKEKSRKSLIFKQRKNFNANGANKVRLMFTHTQANPPIHMWIRQGKKLLARNDKAKEIGGRIQIGSRQPKNLQRLIGGSKGGGGGAKNTPQDAGCWKCNRCKVVCPILKEGNRFKSTNTG